MNEVVTTWLSESNDLNADLVFANILAPILIAECETIKNSVHETGLIVLSGMRDEQVQQVLLSYSNCIELERESHDGWTAVVLQKS